MSNVIEITSANFKQEVINSNQPVLVDFAAEWCGPCKRLSPIVEDIANETKGQFKICHLDIDESSDIAAQYDIMSVPTILFFKNGEVKDKSLGLVSKSVLMGKLNSL